MLDKPGLRGPLLLTTLGVVLFIGYVLLKIAGVVGQPTDIGGGFILLVAYPCMIGGVAGLVSWHRNSRRDR